MVPGNQQWTDSNGQLKTNSFLYRKGKQKSIGYIPPANYFEILAQNKGLNMCDVCGAPEEYLGRPADHPEAEPIYLMTRLLYAYKKSFEKVNQEWKIEWGYLCESCINSKPQTKIIDNNKNNILPGKLQDKTFDNYKTGNTKYIKDITKILIDKKNILFMGKNESGKTHLASAALNYLVNTGLYKSWDVLFTMTETMISNIQESVFDKELSLNEDFYKKVPLLVIDELSQFRTSSDSPMEKLTSVIIERENAKLQTICTTDLEPEDASKFFGNRLWVRLKRMELIPVKKEEQFYGK